MNELEKKVADLVFGYLNEDNPQYFLSGEISELSRAHSEEEVMPCLYKAAAALYWDEETLDECEIQEGSAIAEVVTGIYWSAKTQAEKAILEVLGLSIKDSGGYLCDITSCGYTPLLNDENGRKELLTELINDLTRVRDSL